MHNETKWESWPSCLVFRELKFKEIKPVPILSCKHHYACSAACSTFCTFSFFVCVFVVYRGFWNIQDEPLHNISLNEALFLSLSSPTPLNTAQTSQSSSFVSAPIL